MCRTSDVIGTDDQVRSQNLDRREREGRALWVDRSYARPELHADVERHDSTVEVCAMEAVVACAVQLNHRFGVPAQVSYEFAVAVPPKHGGMGLHAESVQGECEAPAEEELGHVGRDLDACASARLAEGGGGGSVEDGDVAS